MESVWKHLEWAAQAKKALDATPEDIQDEMGYALELVQRGEIPRNSQRMRGALRDVCEITADDVDGATYRTMYTVELGDTVYVLDVFKKKSKRGIATPQIDLDRIANRLQLAREHYAKANP